MSERPKLTLLDSSTPTYKLKMRTRKTPDFSALRFFKRIPLFVYGTAMKDGENNNLLKGAEYYGKAHTISPSYQMKYNKHFPVVFDAQHNKSIPQTQHHRIRGELYGVTVEHLHLVDVLESNTLMFNRVKTRVLLENQDRQSGLKFFAGMPFCETFMYVANTAYWDGVELDLRYVSRYPSDPKLVGQGFYQWTNFSEWDYDNTGTSSETETVEDEFEQAYETEHGFWAHHFGRGIMH